MINNKQLQGRKGQNSLNGILTILLSGGIMLTIVIIAIAIGADITTDIRDDSTAGSLVTNVSNSGLDALGNLSGQTGLIGTVIALSVVLLLLVVLLFKNFAGGVR